MWMYSDQWAAGFFDGEGCIQIEPRVNRYRTSYYVNVTVVQNDQRPLQAFQEHFGGLITSASRRASRWRASGARAERFLKTIAPYLLVKRQQADLALQMRARIGVVGVHVEDQTEHAERKAIYDAFRETFQR